MKSSTRPRRRSSCRIIWTGRGRKNAVKKLLRFIILLLLLAIGAAAALMYVRVHAPYRGFEGAEQFVEIPQGAGSRTIGDRLVEAGVIRDLVTYRLAVYLSGQGRRLK